ncbi:lipoprotein N-acyltransferase Lnb domain-containing protein [Hyphomonas pacifica]|uniref:Lnb N-terminal periplasmic domain-containing protein n=1 Tax=Hyphomonas pacifica TaxID=1280941 RepID=A0A062U4C9_9PROT|nr:DUF4105 domain-containing protein [Hyphomonas pacifica]KCZ53137.1 hypothetical protein HY2_01015 [Hyphomonas pacifica]RAN34637.1 hypothetical protein HY11_14860 [Hyphomonas pacifica]RAN36003.1 hypothetical protein HY3_00060 [Hyphomonas pacifica]
MKNVAVLLALGCAALLFVVAVVAKQPRHDRDWQPHLSRLPHVEMGEGIFQVSPYRDWSYPVGSGPVQIWKRLPSHRIEDVRRAWFVVEPHPGQPLMAHTLVLFEFADGDLIGLTVEARKEAGEKYSVVRGALNGFELIYQWATPRDLLARRAVYLNKELYLYPLVLSQEEVEAYLTALLQRTESIETHARFYNTLTSNCTNELAKTAGLDWDFAFILTGRADAALYRMGRIEGRGPFESVRQSARIDPAVRTLADLPDAAFNARLLSDRRGGT